MQLELSDDGGRVAVVVAGVRYRVVGWDRQRLALLLAPVDGPTPEAVEAWPAGAGTRGA